MVTGPGTAFVATCARLRWTIIDGLTLRTDDGFHLDLTLDPPAAVQKQVIRSVERWRWRNIEDLHPELAENGSGRGAMMEAIWTLLRSKQNNEEWGPKLKGALMSVFSGRQFPQTRAMAAGWATYNRCLACLQHIVEAEETVTEKVARIERQELSKKTGIFKVHATEEQIAKAPVGNLFHRT